MQRKKVSPYCLEITLYQTKTMINHINVMKGKLTQTLVKSFLSSLRAQIRAKKYTTINPIHVPYTAALEASNFEKTVEKSIVLGGT